MSIRSVRTMVVFGCGALALGGCGSSNASNESRPGDKELAALAAEPIVQFVPPGASSQEPAIQRRQRPADAQGDNTTDAAVPTVQRSFRIGAGTGLTGVDAASDAVRAARKSGWSVRVLKDQKLPSGARTIRLRTATGTKVVGGAPATLQIQGFEAGCGPAPDRCDGGTLQVTVALVRPVAAS